VEVMNIQDVLAPFSNPLLLFKRLTFWTVTVSTRVV